MDEVVPILRDVACDRCRGSVLKLNPEAIREVTRPPVLMRGCENSREVRCLRRDAVPSSIRRSEEIAYQVSDHMPPGIMVGHALQARALHPLQERLFCRRLSRGKARQPYKLPATIVGEVIRSSLAEHGKHRFCHGPIQTRPGDVTDSFGYLLLPEADIPIAATEAASERRQRTDGPTYSHAILDGNKLPRSWSMWSIVADTDQDDAVSGLGNAILFGTNDKLSRIEPCRVVTWTEAQRRDQ